jgi:hypothetical protein
MTGSGIVVIDDNGDIDSDILAYICSKPRGVMVNTVLRIGRSQFPLLLRKPDVNC